ncbi:hypothetical protein [Klebsiella oxytoca]|uniref:hypothetical protein n=1 Tax=Klebsiella oxytoca TaxID=571 RepID=UPI001EE91CD7|nr:hypothetical protein [Klebsiella oxytoca]
MAGNYNYNSAPNNESPRRDGPPSRTNENAQIQWLIESVTQLKTSHESLNGKIEQRFECLETKIDARNQTTDARVDARHQTTEQKISGNHDLLMNKIETMELRIQKSISDSKVDGIKWAIGLAIGLPSVAWMVIQIVKAVIR